MKNVRQKIFSSGKRKESSFSNVVGGGGGEECLNNFKLSCAEIHLLIYCQIVTGSVISAWEARMKRQDNSITIVLQRANLGRYKGARGREEGSCPGWELMRLASPLEERTEA